MEKQNKIFGKILEWLWLGLTLLCFIFVIINGINNVDFTAILGVGIGAMAMWRILILENKDKINHE